MVAEVAVPTLEDAKKAAECAMKAWPEWRDMKVEKRAAMLEKVAGTLESDRLELAALEAYEVGKPWREADADVAEAIDFCRYYARRALPELAPRSLGETPGEKNIQFYEGRGPTLVIAPWNFPAAILTGMTAAALVAGNSVIMKPSGKSCGTAWAVYRKMIAAGIPPEILQFLPGAGETVGDFLAGHPLIAQIAFTGSSEVGLSIIRKGADTKDSQPQVRRFVCEMGGKNAIIVDEDADPDEAVLGVIESAFGYAGQKCSACSRVIVVGKKTYEQFTARLVEACKSVIIAPAHRPGCRLGPVINEEAFNKLRAVIEQPGDGATPLYLGEENPVPEGGYYIPPAIFEVHDANHTLMQRELFGPVAAVMPVKSFDEALKAAASTRYALTGGVYSRSPGNLEKARKLFRVGNLYFNRAITGALVNRQPFGGFGMSGIGTKAGGPGYLKNFAEPRTVTENSMRHGFTPEIDR
jgi:RHH-type proline utilization regulon transcriptional repressor/proline dehydrogenase/delta 1-pyrroline-5-carboxylate dehydrogenase